MITRPCKLFYVSLWGGHLVNVRNNGTKNCGIGVELIHTILNPLMSSLSQSKPVVLKGWRGEEQFSGNGGWEAYQYFRGIWSV